MKPTSPLTSTTPEPIFHRAKPPSTGVLLVNLGTPDAPTAPALRRYLAEFLADRRVIEIPKIIWLLILHGIILRQRQIGHALRQSFHSKSAARIST